ncbi:hypothetical protein GCM10007216_27520 [Thalassobacillus devorans]|uniref:DUF4083 domain-containing protein n=1 Tax=Thalassobacillus devorans TaxID=279813 RepID=A0ABQ1PDS0_9BACI|nr:hypothetical protein [Thalassobacillus devorans]NIK29254.1 cell division protein FtsB [Thalassobacillus devorans]GGC95260.1 hypothetical protein GCM10007216_27520 [Thalassobacillus devorans]
MTLQELMPLIILFLLFVSILTVVLAIIITVRKRRKAQHVETSPGLQARVDRLEKEVKNLKSK